MMLTLRYTFDLNRNLSAITSNCKVNIVCTNKIYFQEFNLVHSNIFSVNKFFTCKYSTHAVGD